MTTAATSIYHSPIGFRSPFCHALLLVYTSATRQMCRSPLTPPALTLRDALLETGSLRLLRTQWRRSYGSIWARRMHMRTPGAPLFTACWAIDADFSHYLSRYPALLSICQASIVPTPLSPAMCTTMDHCVLERAIAQLAHQVRPYTPCTASHRSSTFNQGYHPSLCQ